MTRPAVKYAFSVAAVILGAGRFARMGQPKLLLPWGGTTVLGHLIEQWRALGAKQIAVVRAPSDLAVRTELDRLGLPDANRICNPAPRSEEHTSELQSLRHLVCRLLLEKK